MASRSITPDVHGASPKQILELARKLNVRSMRLQFTDILGVNKNVEIPASQFAKALAGDIMFDGSSIEGFVRIEESDMLLAPDLSTFRLFPMGPADARVARVICDINLPNGDPFPGDPRGVTTDGGKAGTTLLDAGASTTSTTVGTGGTSPVPTRANATRTMSEMPGTILPGGPAAEAPGEAGSSKMNDQRRSAAA